MKSVTAWILAAGLFLTMVGTTPAQYVMDLGSLIAAITRGDLTDEVEGVHDAVTVYVTRVSSMGGIRIQGDRLSRAIERRERVLWYFRSSIKGARKAMRALEIHGQTLDQVIWATHTNDRSAMLYVDDR